MKKILLALLFVLFVTACADEVPPAAEPENVTVEQPNDAEISYEPDIEVENGETEPDEPTEPEYEPEEPTEPEDEPDEPTEPEYEPDEPTEPEYEPDETSEDEPDEQPEQEPEPEPEPEAPAIPALAEPLRVVATIFPQYDFVRRITGGRVDLSLLISPGAESHGFEPTPGDMLTIGRADLLIYVGGHKDDWVESKLAAVERPDMPTVALLDMVEAIVVLHAEDCDDDDCDLPHHVEHYDEHVWTCPRNAIIIVNELTNVLAEKDPANADFFRENASALVAELQALDRAFVEVVANGVRNTIIFGDRFPFIYFVETYGLTHFAAFDGCCSDTQASPATIGALINRVRDENIPVVFHIELSNRIIANTIAEDTGARILELHSAHNVSTADFNAGVGYVQIMWRNVENLREALS